MGHRTDTEDDIPWVLRVSPEPFRHVTDAQAFHLLTDAPADYLAYLRRRLERLANDAEALWLPPKQVYDDGPDLGDFRVMPCVAGDRDGFLKTVKVVGTNRTEHKIRDQITVGKALVLHPRDNHVTHVVDACILSSARTAACAALAMERLAPQAKHVAVLGAGRVGWFAALYVATLPGVARIELRDTVPGRGEAVARDLAARLPHIQVGVADPGYDVDTLILATDSRQPVCAPGDVRSPLVISLGADSDDQSELHPDWAGRAAVFVDTLDAVRHGDLKRWRSEGRLKGDEPTELLELYRGGRPGSAPCLFISTGSALFDNLTLCYLTGLLEQQAR